MPRSPKGHVEQLPSGSYRVSVYAGTDPITKKQLYFRATVKTQTEASIKLGNFIAKATDGRQPESALNLAQLLDQYTEVADWEVSTRESNERYIKRTIKPALGHVQIRKVRGPLLDLFYARLRRCGDLACTGKPFTEHRNVPMLAVEPHDRRPAWQQIADTFRAAICCGQFMPGETLPSVREIKALQGIKTATTQHAFSVLANEGHLIVRQGRTAVVAGDTAAKPPRSRKPLPTDHDCRRAGCKPHKCRPMKPKTIRNIHSILSGAFEAAKRWEWIDSNPAESAKLPTVRQRPKPATPPEDVAKVIVQARASNAKLALYIWLVAITGARRGELCGLQVCDVDLDNRVVHIAFNYLVRDGRRIRKDTKTHQVRHLAIDAVTCAMLREHIEAIRSALAVVGVELPDDAYVFSNDPSGATAWNPDWATHKVADLAADAGVKLNINGLRHYTASQLLAAGFDLRNTAARLGHGSGGATTLRFYADPVTEVDRRAAAYLAQLTAPTAIGETVPSVQAQDHRPATRNSPAETNGGVAEPRAHVQAAKDAYQVKAK